MKIYNTDKRTHGVYEYIHYLNRKVTATNLKERPDDDDKLARVLLFNLEHYSRYHQERGLIVTLYVLDHYAKVEQDKGDVFQRPIINLSAVPTKVRRKLYSEYREYNNTIETLLTADDATIQKLVEEGKIILEIDEDEIEQEEDKKDNDVKSKKQNVEKKGKRITKVGKEDDCNQYLNDDERYN